MRAKLGRARPISETELSFLGTFHLRFRKAAEEARHEDTPSAPEPVEIESDEAPAEPAPKKRTSAPPASPPAASASNEKSKPAGRPRRAVQTDVETAATTREAQARRGEQKAGAARAAAKAEDDIPTNVLRSVDAEGDTQGTEEPGHKAEDREKAKLIGPKKLQEALDTNDHRTVLRELYREVTAIAEGVWSSEISPAPLVWEQVTASDWYERNFSRLGLQPLSVFYEVTTKVDKKVRGGADRKDLQEFLKETNFAKTLLSLRDMFQANNI
jgi:hypothetical protein